MGLRREDVDSFEQEILAQTTQNLEALKESYQQKLQRYEQEFYRAIESEYPFSNHVRNGLNDRWKSLGLKSEDIEQIENPMLSQKFQQNLESEQQKQKKEQERLKSEQENLEYQRKLKRYEMEFHYAVDSEYPLSLSVRNKLIDSQKLLALKSEDIKEVENYIIVQKEAEYRQRLLDGVINKKLGKEQKENTNSSAQSFKYGVFWLRLLAFSVDTFISALIGFHVFTHLAKLLPQDSSISNYSLATFIIICTVISVFLYYILFETSPMRATIGKIIFGLIVTDLNGKQIGFLKSSFRFILKSSFISMGLGISFPWLFYLVLALQSYTILSTKKKQSIDDLITGCIVVRKEWQL
ncbi:RDD family protein [Pseudanabaena galeata UHCC 0370]|uniref:RDD family protein n=1 Tax=Pseudanabaena galeata UHCC 0370 TaxID=3110310 RepID=A0ABU5TII6_9CYAN|nr:RDD family protein [Pseudanabaena galeata]MEA5478135.1 RDD family protein [Pseudanabaena galeata UHCC 0370]